MFAVEHWCLEMSSLALVVLPQLALDLCYDVVSAG
jgi:hypothetical protein